MFSVLPVGATQSRHEHQKFEVSLSLSLSLSPTVVQTHYAKCGAAVGLFLPRSMACAFGLPALDGNGCGQPLYLLIGASRKYAGGSHEHRDCSRRTHGSYSYTYIYIAPASTGASSPRVQWDCKSSTHLQKAMKTTKQKNTDDIKQCVCFSLFV